MIVRMHPHGAVLYPAPLGCGYSSEAPKNLSAPIAGFFALEQSSLNQISRMTSSQAVAALLASAMSVRFDEAVENRFELAVKLAGTPIQKLKFSQSPDFWRMILTTDRERNKEPE